MSNFHQDFKIFQIVLTVYLINTVVPMSEDYKDHYKPLDYLLFFSDSGCGDLFGFAILNGQVQTDDIFVWDHETDCRNFVAVSLEIFLKDWITGRISI